jgi:hypothetical protein
MIWTVLDTLFKAFIYGSAVAAVLLIFAFGSGLLWAIVRGVLAFIFVLPLGIACGIYDLVQKGKAQ